MQTRSSTRVVFLGTPDFAVGILDALVEAGFQVVGVVTMPDKPSGRGQKLSTSAVKDYALSRGLALLQPEKLRDPSFIEALSSWKADIQVVVAFRMLPEIVWNQPPQGTINLHASLLPDYRGAAPINHAIFNGEQESGVTTFRLNAHIDTGDILYQKRTPLSPRETAQTLHDKLMALGAELMVYTLDEMLAGKGVGQAQARSEEAKPAPKIFKEHCLIDWTRSAEAIDRQIRGLSPSPTAFTYLHRSNGEILPLKIFECEIGLAPFSPPQACGSLDWENGHLDICVGQSERLRVLNLQLSGKKRLNSSDFLRGFHPEAGDTLCSTNI